MPIHNLDVGHAETLTVGELLDFASSVRLNVALYIQCDYTEESEEHEAESVTPKVQVMGPEEHVRRFIEIFEDDRRMVEAQELNARQREAEIARDLQARYTAIARELLGPDEVVASRRRRVRLRGVRRLVRDVLRDIVKFD